MTLYFNNEQNIQSEIFMMGRMHWKCTMVAWVKDSVSLQANVAVISHTAHSYCIGNFLLSVEITEDIVGHWYTFMGNCRGFPEINMSHQCTKLFKPLAGTRDFPLSHFALGTGSLPCFISEFPSEFYILVLFLGHKVIIWCYVSWWMDKRTSAGGNALATTGRRKLYFMAICTWL